MTDLVGDAYTAMRVKYAPLALKAPAAALVGDDRPQLVLGVLSEA